MNGLRLKDSTPHRQHHGPQARRRPPGPRHRSTVALAALLCLWPGGPAAAQEPPGEPLPDPSDFRVEPPATAQAAAWGLRLSAGLEARQSRSPPQWPGGNVAVGVLDARHEWALGDSTRLTWSSRLEWSTGTEADTGSRHVLREAHLSHDLGGQRYIDLGRVQLRTGVAQGWNPTDWLRGNSVGPAQQSPTAARENRIGAVMLRAQQTGNAGSAEIALVPQLRDRKGGTLPDWGWHLDRGNDARALFLRIAPRTGERISLDLSALAREGQAPGWGLGLTTVASPRWLAVLEGQWQSRQALVGPDAPQSAARLHTRMAAGLSVTLDTGAVLGAEWHHASDALGRESWQAWRDAAAQSPATRRALGSLRAERGRQLEPLLRNSLYLRLQWNDVRRDGRLDLSGFARLNPYDHSRWWQLEGAWHLSPDWSMRLALAATQGDPLSEHGARAQRRVVAISSEHHF